MVGKDFPNRPWSMYGFQEKFSHTNPHRLWGIDDKPVVAMKPQRSVLEPEKRNRACSALTQR